MGASPEDNPKHQATEAPANTSCVPFIMGLLLELVVCLGVFTSGPGSQSHNRYTCRSVYSCALSVWVLLMLILIGVVKLMHLDTALYSDVVLSEGFFHQLFISTIQSL